MSSFANRSVLITGGTSGIGYATAERFLKNGANVFICSRSPERVDRALQSLSPLGNVKGLAADLTDEDQAKTLVNQVVADFGKLDILVNSAGLAQPGKIADISLKDFRQIVDANLTSTFLMCQLSWPHLKKTNGKIVNVSSLAGRFRSSFSGVHYTSAKAGVLGLTRQLALEFGPDGINVNALCPGPTKTEMLEPFLNKFGEDKVKDLNPLGRLMLAEDAAGPILFLCSEEARCITGSSLDVNCGIF